MLPSPHAAVVLTLTAFIVAAVVAAFASSSRRWRNAFILAVGTATLLFGVAGAGYAYVTPAREPVPPEAPPLPILSVTVPTATDDDEEILWPDKCHLYACTANDCPFWPCWYYVCPCQ